MLSIAKSIASVTRMAWAKGMHLQSPFDTDNTNLQSFVEYETAADLATAVEKLDNHTFKDATVRCISDVSPFPHRERENQIGRAHV